MTKYIPNHIAVNNMAHPFIQVVYVTEDKFTVSMFEYTDADQTVLTYEQWRDYCNSHPEEQSYQHQRQITDLVADHNGGRLKGITSQTIHWTQMRGGILKAGCLMGLPYDHQERRFKMLMSKEDFMLRSPFYHIRYESFSPRKNLKFRADCDARNFLETTFIFSVGQHGLITNLPTVAVENIQFDKAHEFQVAVELEGPSTVGLRTVSEYLLKLYNPNTGEYYTEHPPLSVWVNATAGRISHRRVDINQGAGKFRFDASGLKVGEYLDLHLNYNPYDFYQDSMLENQKFAFEKPYAMTVTIA